MNEPSRTDDPFFISLETLIASSPLLGHELENRRPIREAQDADLVRHFGECSRVALSNEGQRKLFACAPLDVLACDFESSKQFHIIELNGTGIGGVTNMPGSVVAPITASIQEIAELVQEPDGVFLLGISGKESPDKPRVNHLMHEKMLFAEALKSGLRKRFGHATVATMPQLGKSRRALENNHPVVVMGYMKELLSALELDGKGMLELYGRPVRGILNDRFCLNVLDHFGHRVDLTRLVPVNSCFLPGADKAVAYQLMNHFLEVNPSPCFPRQVLFKNAANRDVLVGTVVDWLRRGHRVVIKPHATGVGHGIEFFLDCNMSIGDVIDRIDGSIRLTASYYNATGGAFPYTVCEFVDACWIRDADHPLYNHKYELRVVVYRDGGSLRAFPSIVKVASRAYCASAPERLSLINNVTAATENSDKQGVDFVLPLTNQSTLALLGLSMGEMEALCQATTRYVRYVLDELQARPEELGFRAFESRRG